jgi:hypothetical protein
LGVCGLNTYGREERDHSQRQNGRVKVAETKLLAMFKSWQSGVADYTQLLARLPRLSFFCAWPSAPVSASRQPAHKLTEDLRSLIDMRTIVWGIPQLSHSSPSLELK